MSCFRSQLTLDPSIGAPSVAAHGFELLLLVGMLVAIKMMNGRVPGVHIALVCGLVSVCLFRVVVYTLWMIWFAAPAQQDVVFNRLAWFAQISTMLLLLYLWMSMVHSQFSHGTSRFLLVLKVVFFFLVFALFVSMCVPTILFYTQSSSNSASGISGAAYEAQVFAVTSFQGLVAIVYAAYGIVLFAMLRRRSAPPFVVWSVFTMAIAVFAAFSVQFFIQFARAVFGLCIPAPVFHAFYYVVPQFILVEVVFVLCLVRGLSKEERQQEHTSNSLDEPLVPSSRYDFN